MSKLSIFDIVALAKAGYKAADIKELTELDIETPETPEKEDGDKKEPDAEKPAKESGKDEQEPAPDDDNIDYKSLYETKCKELEEAQKKNVHQNQPEPKQTKTLDDIVRSYM